MSRLTFNNVLHFRLVGTQIYHLLSEDLEKYWTTYGTFTPNYFKKHDHLLHYTEDRNNMRVSKLF